MCSFGSARVRIRVVRISEGLLYRFSTNDHDKANLFNELCLNQVIFHHLTPVFYTNSSYILFWETSLSLRLMCTFAVANLDETKATSLDGTPARVLKYCSCILVSPIKHLSSQ